MITVILYLIYVVFAIGLTVVVYTNMEKDQREWMDSIMIGVLWPVELIAVFVLFIMDRFNDK